jgi:DNA excision repair protein ERCC-1
VLSSVKGLGATKVTSLVDAFTKPFLIGGLKRGDSAQASTSLRIGGPGGGELEVTGSPEWPEDEVDEEGMGLAETPARGRERVPSRSPELLGVNGIDKDEPEGAWKDPLDDEEDDDEDDEDAEREGGPAKKRSRVE